MYAVGWKLYATVSSCALWYNYYNNYNYYNYTELIVTDYYYSKIIYNKQVNNSWSSTVY